MGRKPSPPDKDPTPHWSISGLILVGLCVCAADWVIAYFGVLLAGGCAALLNGWWTGEEMADWLNSWGTADEGECPPCHV